MWCYVLTYMIVHITAAFIVFTYMIVYNYHHSTKLYWKISQVCCRLYCYDSTYYSCIYCVDYQKPTAQLQVPWFPRRIQDLERACKTVFNYGEEFTPDHPVSCVQIRSTYIKLPCPQKGKFYLCTLDRLSCT